MKELFFVLLMSSQFVNAGGHIRNPCGESFNCSDSRAEMLIHVIHQKADEMESKNRVLRNMLKNGEDVSEILFQIQTSYSIAHTYYKNFEKYLGIQDNVQRITTIRRYQGQLWTSYNKALTEKHKAQSVLRRNPASL